MSDLQGRTAVVTGGGGGLGAATCRSLARLGANVLVNYASSADAAEAVAAECREIGVEAAAMRGDVGEDADCRAVADAAKERWGRIDVLVNNAGVTKMAPQEDLEALTGEDFARIYRVNVIGVYQMTRAAAPAMREAGGASIVNVSSIAGTAGVGSSIAYAASKGALNTLTLTLARALAPDIRVNAVCPGYIASGWFTKWGDAATDEMVASAMRETTPLKQASTPEDIAEAIAFLASPKSGHVTGEHLMIDAGMHLGFTPLKAR